MTLLTTLFVFGFVFASLVLIGAGFSGVWSDIKQWRSASESAFGQTAQPQEAGYSWRPHNLR